MEKTELFSLRDLLRVLFSHKIYFIVFPSVLMVLAYIGTDLKTPDYTARVKMFVKARKTTQVEFYKEINSKNIIKDHTTLINSNIVLERVVEALKLYERPPDSVIERKYASDIKKYLIDSKHKKQKERMDMRLKERMAQGLDKDISQKEDKSSLISSAVIELSARISTQAISDTNAFYIAVTDFESGYAQKIANSVSRSYLIYDIEQQIEELKLKYGEKNSTIIQLKNYADNFKKTLDGRVVPEVEAIGPATVKIIYQAQGAFRSRKPSKLLFVSFALFAGLFVASIFAAISNYFNNTLRTPKDITDNLDIEFLSSVPKRKNKDQLIMIDPDVHSPLSCIQAFQRFGDKICLISKNQNIKSFLVTACEEFEDTSALIANLALYLSRDVGKKVLVIDANLLNPVMNKMLKLNGRPGLIDMFEAKTPLESAVISVNKNLDVLTSKTVNFRPIKLLDSPFMHNVIKEASSHYDLVFVDCGVDLRYYADPIILSEFTDAVLIVINQSIDRVRDVQIAVKNIRHKKDKVILSILNNRNESIPKFLYKRIS